MYIRLQFEVVMCTCSVKSIRKPTIVGRSGVFLGADWERACFTRPRSGVSYAPTGDGPRSGAWSGDFLVADWGRRLSSRRLTTSHSKIIGQPRRLSLPHLSLPRMARKRSNGPAFPPMQQAGTSSRRASSTPNARKRAPRMTPVLSPPGNADTIRNPQSHSKPAHGRPPRPVAANRRPPPAPLP